MDSHLEYLEWLKSQIKPARGKIFNDLFEILHAKEFVWIIPNDDNRVEDGMELRYEFFHRNNILSQGCSVLEVLIGLSRRLTFAAGGNSEDWAWGLVTNLGLHHMSGRITKTKGEAIDETLERLIWRTYQPDGIGGFFPLAWPTCDQRRVELWYQMSAYIDELPEL